MMRKGRLLPAGTDVELRLVHIHDVPQGALLPRCWKECERAARFRFARHRHRFLAGRGMLRHMLADWSGLAPDGLRFGETGNGKPILLDRPDLHFNLSYSDDHILIGVTRRSPLGVDIERRRPFPQALALAEDCFDAEERTALCQARPGMSESDLFLSGWTRKEACLKACGIGLSQDPAEIPTGLDHGARTVNIGAFVHARVETLIQNDNVVSWAKMV
ncbi:4'-phosphopantetheinyl transferase superfamily protein [Sphingobium sp. PNB]|uniref:4'-phosphopantetheinyl transferase family protein n=1 Tax=Sphingobium sp. PNB TaxID=863934 RepID=UPI001CA3CBB4|nr:4'-phosphopantetheinyl transferase superfamily protein [Sphingobium sp. PNB]MCB4858159.1 4'-phosphopantetheinyl transferase superfamily protein [Sphingobium sp. PNB]